MTPRRPTSSTTSSGPRPRGGSVRVPSGSPTDRLVIVRIESELPETVWVSAFTRNHPDLLLEIHNLMAVRQLRALADIEIHGRAMDWMSEIAGFSDVEEVHPSGLSSLASRYRVLFRARAFVPLLVKLEVLVRHPSTVRQGVLRFEVVNKASTIRRLVGGLRGGGFDVRIVSIREESTLTRRSILTSGQRSLFRQALASGYYAVPRRISLTRLALGVSKSKSTVSRRLALLEQRLLEFADSRGA